MMNVVLGSLGIAAAEESVYRYLIGRSHASAAYIATGTGLSAAQVDAALTVLLSRRFVTEVAGDPGEYAAIRPDEAYEPLLRERQHELDTARTTVERMLAEYRAVPRAGSVHDVLEIVEGQEAAGRRFDQLYDAAQRSHESFVKAPLLVRGVDTEHEPFRSDGVYRVVYDPDALSVPGMVAAVAEDIAGGEEARAAPVPLKMALFDRERAFLPISQWRTGNEPVALIVHGSELAAALGALFDAVWTQAEPLQLTPDGLAPGDDPNRPAGDDMVLLSLLRAGLTDEAIARQTGTSSRTVSRRIRRLMDLTGTESRFQLGVRAVERGWLDGRAPQAAGPKRYSSS